MSALTNPSYRWIETAEQLDAACREVENASVIALDTEFFRENTFFPIPALIQFSAGDLAYLVDPVATSCTDAFRALLQNAALKLLHACSEDLEVLKLWTGVLPTPLVDTQIAQALLGVVPVMGYQKMVEFWVGDTLPKEETRSNWLTRPLSASQCEYAALDVIYLLRVWALQAARLEMLGRRAWLGEECAAALEQTARGGESDALWYTRHRQLWRLTPQELEAYRQMTRWREGEIRRRDLPRNWLAADKLLFAIAEAMPKNRFELAAVEGVKPTLIKKEGDTLLDLVKKARHCSEEALPMAWPDPAEAGFKRCFKVLKKVITAKAAALEIAPEVLMRRRDIEALVMQHRAGQTPRYPGGWRGEILNDALREALKEGAA